MNNNFNPNVALLKQVLENDIKYLDLLLNRRQNILQELSSLEAKISSKEDDIQSAAKMLKRYYGE